MKRVRDGRNKELTITKKSRKPSKIDQQIWNFVETLLLASKARAQRDMTGVSKRSQPEPWQSGQGDDARLQQALDSCEKENRWLNDLVIRIGENVMRRIKGWKA
jgi:hypothetical protein